MAKASEAQIRANAKYDAANTIQFKLKLNKTSDAEIIEQLQAQSNKQGYIKNLILQDIKKLTSQDYKGE